MTDWTQFIEMKHQKGALRPLYLDVIHKYFSNTSETHTSSLRAVNFGSGAAKEDLDLLKKGWDVLSIDSNPLTHEILSNDSKNLKGTSKSINDSFEEAKLDGKYDLIMSFNSLPFGQKNTLDSIFKNISHHLKEKTGLFVANFFGTEHGFVKQEIAYALSHEELSEKLLKSKFEIIEIKESLIKDYKTQAGDPITWHDFKVIAKKASY